MVVRRGAERVEVIDDCQCALTDCGFTIPVPQRLPTTESLPEGDFTEKEPSCAGFSRSRLPAGVSLMGYMSIRLGG